MAHLTKLTDRDAVLAAIGEFRKLGRDKFLAKYGFKRAREYFVEHDGAYFDSKAITAVAYGYQYPSEGPLKFSDFSSGKATVDIALRRLDFRVYKNPFSYLVLVENEVHARPEFAKWQDVTGERYHFPNGYRNKIVPGREFVYYKGSRRKSGRSTPEYFGFGRIGAVYLDATTAHLPAARQAWLCDIEDYRPFERAVLFRDEAGRFLELLSDNAPVRYWEAGVREISQRAYHAILSRAGVNVAPTAPAETIAPEDVVPQQVADPLGLLLLVSKEANKKGATRVKNSWSRRSARAKEIGDRAEQAVLTWLQRTAETEQQRERIVWVASNGETPGWDIEDRRNSRKVDAYEVKGTNGSLFPNFEITANEWAAAERLRTRYNLVLVCNCETATPQINVINDPWALVESGALEIIPTAYRLSRLK